MGAARSMVGPGISWFSGHNSPYNAAKGPLETKKLRGQHGGFWRPRDKLGAGIRRDRHHALGAANYVARPVKLP